MIDVELLVEELGVTFPFISNARIAVISYQSAVRVRTRSVQGKSESVPITLLASF